MSELKEIFMSSTINFRIRKRHKDEKKVKRQRKDQIIQDDTTRNKATFFTDTYTRFEKSLFFFPFSLIYF